MSKNENITEHTYENPTDAIEAAICQLESFTKSEAGYFEIQTDGSLTTQNDNALSRVKNLVSYFIAPLISEQADKVVKEKLNFIKKKVLKAKDTLLSHATLIKNLEKGDISEQRLARSALDAIEKYNAVVENDYSSWTTRYNFYNERNQLLRDDEIKQKIELPNTFSIHYESHTPSEHIQKSFKNLSHIFLKNSLETMGTLKPKLKKSAQLMMDTFRLKAMRMVQSHFTHHQSTSVIIDLIKQTPIEDVSEDDQLILLRQIVEEAPGFRIILTGSFKRLTIDSKLMSMPILESFHLASQVAHAGFPYPSQHMGWSLSEVLVQAYPLRADQAPLFQQIEQKRKNLAQALLFKRPYIQKAQKLFKLKKEVFNRDRELFLSFHQALQESILRAVGHYSEEGLAVLNSFYQVVQEIASPYDMINYVQQKMNDPLMKDPAAKLEAEWLKVKGSELRKGTPQEKLQTASTILQNSIESVLAGLDLTNPVDAYVNLMGKALSFGSSKIVLQYFSEKIGFVPPVLDDYQQKIQVCAFLQLTSFLDEFSDEEEVLDVEIIKTHMISAYEKDIQIFQVDSIEEIKDLASKIAQELEIYFPSRHFANCPRKSYIPEAVD